MEEQTDADLAGNFLQEAAGALQTAYLTPATPSVSATKGMSSTDNFMMDGVVFGECYTRGSERF